MSAVAEPVSRAAFLKGAAGAALAAAAAPALAGPASAAPAGAGAPGADRPLHDLEITEAARLLRTGRVTAVELAQAVLERSAEVEGRVLTYALEYDADLVLAQARRADRLLRRGRYLGPLHGVPIGLKDIIFTKGIPTEGGSALYRGFRPDFDATCVTRLLEAGAVVVGKTHTIELASGDPAPTNNPWDLQRQPGGSSSGSASGAAAGQFLAGIGTDTRGSIRGPSSNCGLTGYRTTYGMVSKHGVFPLSYTIDNVGPLARSALDAAILVDVMGGHDPQDPTSRPVERYALARALRASEGRRPLRGLRVGVPAPGDYFRGVPSDDQLAAFDEAAAVLASLGATVVSVRTSTLPEPFTTLASMTTPIVNSEVAAFQYDNWVERAEAFTAPYRNQVNNGNVLPASAYVQAQRARSLWNEQFLAMFEDVDVFLHPEDDVAPYKDAERNPARPRPSSGSKRSPWSLTGSPSIAVPTGLSSAERMPLSMLVNAAPGDDELALRVVHAFQQVTDHHRLRPQL
ncbi:amidase [Vallicoccus soli]|uniref:Amidase n=1 Tax=Vallicoccus soli TaxID=2339232 RepID=A0A3A3Z2A8_9ACTN|nr:amidase [Vallicoccus soli]RJK96864.1 amidase [Vallicoccus soli]